MHEPSLPTRRGAFASPRLLEETFTLPGWRGHLRVAHLTDLHFGAVTPLRLIREAIDLANRARPHHVLITGDFVCRGRAFLQAVRSTLRRLEAPAWAVLGNHDHWSGAGAVRAALAEAGVEVLDNRWTWIRGEGAPLPLIGLDDAGTRHHDPDAATHRLPRGPALALSHNPEATPHLWERGASLVLAGHTHGGHVHVGRLTRTVFHDVLGHRFLGGWYAHGRRALFVNPGVGASAFPWRFGRPARRTVAVIDVVG